MQVYINNECDKTIKTMDGLQKILDDLQNECLRNNNILQIFLDGQYIDQIPLEMAWNINERLDIIIKRPEEIVIESLIESLDLLPNLSNALHESALKFQKAQHSEGMQLFHKCIDGLIWINQLLGSMQILFTNEEFNLDGAIYHKVSERFASILKELIVAWENEDFILMSDLTDYELVPVIEDIKEEFNQILTILS